MSSTPVALSGSAIVVQNQRDYVLPALTSSVSAGCGSTPHYGNHGQPGRETSILDAVMLINDGQHRRRDRNGHSPGSHPEIRNGDRRLLL